MSDLRQAAQAVLNRWDSPNWEWKHYGSPRFLPTATLMSALRKALAEQQAEPVHGDIRALKYRIHELEGEVMGYKRMLDVAEAASQPQQQAEPVGEVTAAVDGAFKCEFSQHLPVGTKLYTAPQQQAEPVYKDSTLHLHVGDSSFESWFQAQPFATQAGIKQISRDSYAAGMGDLLVVAAPQQQAEPDRQVLQAIGAHPAPEMPSITRYTVAVEGQSVTYWDNIDDAIANSQRAVYAGPDNTTRAINDLTAGRLAEWSCGFGAVRIYPPQIKAAPPERRPLTVEELKIKWNAQADCMNQWDELGLDEIVAFAQAAHKENT